MPEITISIVTYNCDKTIAATLASLFEHIPESPSISVFIIDNGSTDQTLLKIKPYMDKITFIQSPKGNIGFGSAHNLVIDRIHSDMHIVMNPDITLIDAQSIMALYQYLECHPDTGMVVPRIIDEENKLQYLCRRNPTIVDLVLRFVPGHHFQKRMDYHVMKDKDYTQPFEVPFASGCFMALRTSLFIQLRGFDESYFLYAEDADLTRRVNQQSKTVYVPTAIVCHEWQRSSYKKLSMTIIHIKALIYYFKKWGIQFK